jgi:uncharacterized protein (TIGR02266 family)
MMAETPVTLEVEHASELLERYYPNGGLGGFSVDGRLPSALGDVVLLTVIVGGTRQFRLRCRLAWARHKAARGQRECFGVDFLHEDDPTRVRLLAYARNDVQEAQTRRAPRIEVELPVRFTHAGATSSETVMDLSLGGAFIRTLKPIGLGELLELHIRPPLALRSINLVGQVAWTNEKGRMPGMGIEFIGADDKTQHKLKKLIEQLSLAKPSA